MAELISRQDLPGGTSVSSSRLPTLRCAAYLGWAASLGIGALAVHTEHILWRVVILITLAEAMVATIAFLILTHLPPIGAVYKIARSAPCDCQPPRLPVSGRTSTGANVIPLRQYGQLNPQDS
jgi:hypothetical protein